jgi:hypothetical protein
MSVQDIVVLTGLVLAGWGHLMINDRLGASTAWRRLDDCFPLAWRSPAPFAGVCLLTLGAFAVLVAALG